MIRLLLVALGSLLFGIKVGVGLATDYYGGQVAVTLSCDADAPPGEPTLPAKPISTFADET
jgi:hypothetical protein